MFIASDLTDTNENLSAALSVFMRWLTEGVDGNEENQALASGRNNKNFFYSFLSAIINRYNRHTPVNFNYLLITNDKSFIAIDQVLPRLASGSPTFFRTKEFRSRFKYLLPVTYHGLAPETSYVSNTYPPVPADSGSLLSKDLVRFLSTSSKSGLLKTFSSIEKSLSIWLAPAGPQYIDDYGWNLDNKTCSVHSMAAFPFDEPKLMMQAWKNYLACGKMCACD